MPSLKQLEAQYAHERKVYEEQIIQNRKLQRDVAHTETALMIAKDLLEKSNKALARIEETLKELRKNIEKKRK